jgi:hypothetical protein
MQKRLTFALAALAVLGVQLMSRAVIVPPPPRTVTLAWHYPEPNTQIVFNIYGTTNLAAPLSEWALITNVVDTSCSLPLNHETCFYTVTASNVVSGLESGYAVQRLD